MDKENKYDKYISTYKIGGTVYEVETAFEGTETLNNKIIRLMLSEKIRTRPVNAIKDCEQVSRNLVVGTIKSKGADNSEEARYNDNTHSVLSDKKRRNVK